MEIEVKKNTIGQMFLCQSYRLIKAYVRTLLAVEFNMNHGRGDLLYNICNEIVLVSQAVGVVMGSWRKKNRKKTLNEM